MGILVNLGPRRQNHWERPKPLDILLTSPLCALTTLLYNLILVLRGRPFRPPPNKPAIRVVCISDTHDQTVRVPPGDLLIHAGDLTNAGTVADIQKQLDWLAALPHAEKVVICGNHDSYFDLSARKPEDRGPGAKKLNLKGLHYLQHESVTLEFRGGRRLKIYGAPDLPACGGSDNAFQYPPDSPPWANTIPFDTDILVTHAPPKHHLDLDLGCPGLLKEVWRVRPKLHIFGHVHWGHGRQAVHFDDCQKAYESLLSRPKRGLFWDFLPHAGWLDALRMLLYGVQGITWKWLMLGPGGNTSSLMINAAQMRGNTGKMGNKPEIVDI